MTPLQVRQNTEVELQAFEANCERLNGFDDAITYEWVDGCLTALAAGPRLPEPAAWLEAIFGDTFGRVFADPADQAQALAALQARLNILCHQLDPEALFDDPEQLRLAPLMAEWDDAERQRAQDEDGLTAEQAALLQTGALWAEGFLDSVQAFPDLWAEPADEEAAAAFGGALDQVAALAMEPGSEPWDRHLAAHYPKQPPTRDELIAEALWSVQDLRMYWVDFAPVTAPRRVEARPGRNDPCPCGSGKKFKKCHGSAVP